MQSTKRQAMRAIALAMGLCGASLAPAAITPTGSTTVGSSPAGFTYVGAFHAGTLTIDGGSELLNDRGYLGYFPLASGTATVTGAGSRWVTDYELYVGDRGSGTLNVQGGAFAGSYYAPTYLGYDTGSSGALSISGSASAFTAKELFVGYGGSGTLNVASGASLNTTTLFASSADLHGNGTIFANGAVLDADIVFDAPFGATKIIPFGSGGQLRLNFNAMVTTYPNFGAGYRGNGSLRISNGVVVNANVSGYLGYAAGSNGAATITGAGSKWSIRDNLYVGYHGNGAMTLEAGGQFHGEWYASIGYDGGSSGTLLVTGAGSKWSNAQGLSIGAYGDGSMRVEAGGQVVSGGFGANAFIAEGHTTGKVIVTGLGSKWAHAGSIYVGNNGAGALNVEAGGWVSNGGHGYLGYFSGWGGVARVDGAASKWTVGTDLYVGHGGDGTLAITNGGLVSNAAAYLAHSTPGWHGTATVSGPGSKWTNSGALSVGVTGFGKLTIADGGVVTARSMSINNKSTARLHVRGDGMLLLGNTANVGTITNTGAVAFYADAFLPAGTYRPVTEFANRSMTWSGPATYQPTGGTWNGAAKTFTVASATALAAGDVDSLSSFKRLLFTDALSGRRMGASFGAITGSANFSASPMGASAVNSLLALLGGGAEVAAAWDFTTDLAAASEMLLSFDIGAGYGDPKIYHHQGGLWRAFEPDLLTYDVNGIVSFTVTSFSGYAVVGVPEPVGLAPVALMTILLRRRRRGGAMPKYPRQRSNILQNRPQNRG